MSRNVGQPHAWRFGRRWGMVGLLAACLAAAAVVALPPAVFAADEEGERPAVRQRGDRDPDVRRERETPREEGREVRRERPAEREGEGEARREGEGRRRGEGEREGEGRRGLPRELAQMAAELGATDAQKKALADKLEAKEAALRKWRQDNADKLKEANDALRKAQEALRAVRAEEQKVAQAAQADVLAVFTPQQLAQWETAKIVKLYHRPDGENPTELSAAQLSRVKALRDEACKELVAAAAKPAAEAATAKGEILNKLQRTIYEDVLDKDQRVRAPRPRGIERPEGEREGEGERRREGAREGERERPREGERERPREGERERPREGGENRERE